MRYYGGKLALAFRLGLTGTAGRQRPGATGDQIAGYHFPADLPPTTSVLIF